MHRALSSAAFALVLLAAAPSALRAQATTQQLAFTFKVPFTFQRLYPDVTEIYFSCFVKLPEASAWAGSGSGPRISVASLTRGADGSVSGEATVSITATISTDAAGKSGNYRCQANGCINGVCGQLSPQNPSSHLQTTAASPLNVAGTLVW